jgi:hypothetical protein
MLMAWQPLVDEFRTSKPDPGQTTHELLNSHLRYLSEEISC